MPKKTLKQLAPSPARLRRWGALDRFGEGIYSGNLWHINRYSASMAFFVGPFVAFLPVPGQMLIAALAAIRLRCNLPLSVGLVWITNPLTAPAILYLAYRVGALVLGVPPGMPAFSLSWSWLSSELGSIWQPLLLGCLLLGLFSGSLGYFVINNLWRWRVGLQWKRRKRARSLASGRPGGPRQARGGPREERDNRQRTGT
jgi:hypothetical protein